MAWADADAGAAADSTGGYSDWRVPTVKEMYSLIGFNGATGTGELSSTTVPADAVPYIDDDYFDFEYGQDNRFIDAQYITSSSYVSTVTLSTNLGAQECFFGVNFADGRIKCYPKTSGSGGTYYVRYVRGNVNYGTNDFQDNSDSTISDNATGLIWMQVDSGDSSVNSSLSGYTKNDGTLAWAEALDFCQNLTFAGSSDWRLPNAKELSSIVDYGRSPDTTSSAAIDTLFSASSITDADGNAAFPFYWTGTTHLDGIPSGGWAVYFAFGEATGLIN